MSKRWLGLLLLGFWIGSSGAAHAALNVSVDPVDFLNVIVNESSTKNTVLSANGGTNVTVTVELPTTTDCMQFQIVAPTMAVPVNMTTPQTVMVKFAPLLLGDRTCT